MAAAVLLAGPLAARAEQVRFVNIGHSYYAASLYIAQRAGIFAKLGLQPTVTVVSGGPLAMQAILSGDADVGVLSYEHVLTAAVQGKRVVSFFNLVNRPTSNVIASRAMVNAAKGLSVAEKIEHLRGKRIGVPSQGGSGDKLARALLAKEGGQASDVSMVYSGASAGSYVAALRRHLIDAAVVPEPAGLMVRAQGSGDVYLNLLGGEVPAFDDMIYMSLVASPEVLAKKHALIAKVVEAFSEAVHLIKTDPERAIALMHEEYPDMSDKMNRQLFGLLDPAWSSTGRMTLAEAQATANYLKPSGSHKLDLPSTFSNDFLPAK